MFSKVDQRLNRIFSAFLAYERKAVTGETAETRRALVDALADSCLLLQDMRSDPNVVGLARDPRSLEALKKLRREGKLGVFLEIERRILGETKLTPETVDQIVSGLGRIGVSPDPKSKWAANIDWFSQLVCGEAKNLADAHRRISLVKRAAFAAAGAFVGLLNTFPPIPVPPTFLPFSIAGGVWLMDKAVGREVDDWLE